MIQLYPFALILYYGEVSGYPAPLPSAFAGSYQKRALLNSEITHT